MTRRQKTLALTALVLCICSSIPQSANGDPSDSIQVTRAVDGFYRWYIGAIKSGYASRANRDQTFSPSFSQDSVGMMTLDFSRYKANLQKYWFSDSLIARELRSYDKCVHCLSMVRYTEFGKTKYTDLDEYEVSDCDFNNSGFRWLGGQESCDSVQISEITFSSQNSCVVSVSKFDSGDDHKRHYWPNHIDVALRRENGVWKIDSIDWAK